MLLQLKRNRCDSGILNYKKIVYEFMLARNIILMYLAQLNWLMIKIAISNIQMKMHLTS